MQDTDIIENPWLPDDIKNRIIAKTIQTIPHFQQTDENQLRVYLSGFEFATEKMIPNILEWLEEKDFSAIKYGIPNMAQLPQLSINDVLALWNWPSNTHAQFVHVIKYLFPYDTNPVFWKPIFEFANPSAIQQIYHQNK